MANPKLILFLDKDNKLLGASAEQVFRMMLEKNDLRNITVVSAGVTNLGFITRDEKMDAVLAQDKIHISGIVNPLTVDLLHYADWVICMDDESRECPPIEQIANGNVNKRIILFSTKQSLSKLVSEKTFDYEQIYEEIKKGCNYILHELESLT